MELQVEGTEARVCADIAARQQFGIKKYGTTVEKNPLTLKDWEKNLYEELLDAAIYLRRLMDEDRSTHTDDSRVH